MKKLFTIITILLFMANGFAQTLNDFIVIDEIAEDAELLKKQFDNSNVYLSTGGGINAINQITNAIKNQQIENLHLFVASKPGALVFSSISIVNSNVNRLALELVKWKSYVSGEIIIHSDVVFSGTEGTQLKHELERLTGLTFTTINN